jgi:hypothetical protein
MRKLQPVALRQDQVQVRALRQAEAHLVRAPVALVSRDLYLVTNLLGDLQLPLAPVGLAVPDKLNIGYILR